jgi:hypothetical protein
MASSIRGESLHFPRAARIAVAAQSPAPHLVLVP